MQLSSRQEREVRIIAKSKLLDVDWYLSRYRDVSERELDPIRHYVCFGAAEGRIPSPGFDPQTYIQNKRKEVVGDANPLVHYIQHGTQRDLIDRGELKTYSLETLDLAMKRLAKLPIFSVRDYLDLNRDVRERFREAAFPLLNHALTRGFSEGRHVFSKITVARVLGALARTPFTAPGTRRKNGAPKLPDTGVYYNSAGNTFIKELAQGLVDALELIGQSAVLLNEKAGVRGRPPLSIIVAPHEFFHLGDGRSWVRDDVVRDAFMFNTEQPQTLWFERAIPFILASKGVLDISCQVGQIFMQSGMAAFHFNPNPAAGKERLLPEDRQHPLFRVLCKAAQARATALVPFSERPIDISFFGTSSRHREAVFSRHAKFFANYSTFLYYRKLERPVMTNDRDGILSRLAAHVAAHSKISLNIHREEFGGFFEWHRIVQLGMLGGSIVVTEPCLPHPIFKSGVHYLEECARHIPDLIEWLIRSKDGQAKAHAIQKTLLGITDPAIARVNSLNLAGFLDEHHRSGR